jgi:hypothetical protein
MSTSAEAGTAVICPRCATENPAHAKFCQRCWAFLRGRRCPHCGKQATRAGAKYCEHCSRDLDAEPTTPLPLDDASNDTAVPSGPRFEPPADGHPHAQPAPQVLEPAQPEAAEPDAPAEAALDESADDQPVMIPFELPEAPGHPFLPPQTPPRPAPQHASQPVSQAPSRPAVQVSAAPDRVEAPAAAAAPAKPQSDSRSVEAVRPQEAVRPKAAPKQQRRSGSPALTVAVVLIVFAAIGAMLALRRQQDEIASQTAASPTQRAAASPVQPAAPPSSQAGAPTQPAPVAAPVGGTIKISTTPAAAKVELDWIQVGVTSSPLTLVDVAPGKHTVKVSKPGFQSQIREVQVASGETITLDLTLPGKASPPPPGRRPAVPPPPPPLPPSP